MASESNVDNQNSVENDESFGRELSLLYKNLRSQALCNIAYYKDAKGANQERLRSSFTDLYEHLERGIESGTLSLLRVVHLYDYAPSVSANGYRSFIKVTYRCCLHILQVSRHITINRDSFLFRAGHYGRELQAYICTLGQLRACLYYLQKLVTYCQDGELFPDEDHLSEERYRTAEELMVEVEALNQETFYGRCLGFQYCSSMVRPLTTITLLMASFGDGYTQNSTVMKLASSVLGSGKYFMDPELRAQQVVTCTRSGDIGFCKSFWSIAENSLAHQLPLFVCPAVEVNQIINIPCQSFDIAVKDGSGKVKVTTPCAHILPAPVSTRLLSHKLRNGQEVWLTKEGKSSPSSMAPKSSSLILHIHGGGFVAQSSASHQMYLRHWAQDTDVPILCVDYSLAPEAPFPRQLEEIFFAYCWALNNHDSLGWTGERICVVGDSAGGNLAVSLCMRIALYNVRQPDGILSVYGCMVIRYTPSPSRMMALMDPLLPLGVLGQVLAAYAGVTTSPGDPPVPAISPIRSPVSSSQSSKSSNQKSPLSSPSSNHNASSDNISLGRGASDHNEETNSSPVLSEECSSDDDISTSGLAMTYRKHRSNGSGDSGFCEPAFQRMGFKKSTDISKTVNSIPESSKNKTSDSSSQSTQQLMLNGIKGLKPAKVKKQNTINTSVIRWKKDADENEETSINLHNNSSSAKSHHNGVPLVHSPNHSKLDKSSLKLELRNNNTRLHLDTRMLRSPSSPSFNVSRLLDRSNSTGTDGARTITPDRSCLESPVAMTPTYAKLRHFAQSPMKQFRNLHIAKNPYMSPYLATEDLLRGLPPLHLVACHLDPMLDDSIEFAKKLRSLGKEVHLELIDDLPHGFLNFVLVSQESKQGSDVCVKKLREILRLDHVPDDVSWEVLKPEPESEAR